MRLVQPRSTSYQSWVCLSAHLSLSLLIHIMGTLSNTPLRVVGNEMDSQYRKDLRSCQASRHSTSSGYFYWKSQGVGGMASSLFEDPSLKVYLFSAHPPPQWIVTGPHLWPEETFLSHLPGSHPRAHALLSCLYTKDRADLEAKCFLIRNRVLKKMVVSLISPPGSSIMTLNHAAHPEHLPLGVRLMSLPPVITHEALILPFHT